MLSMMERHAFDDGATCLGSQGQALHTPRLPFQQEGDEGEYPKSNRCFVNVSTIQNVIRGMCYVCVGAYVSCCARTESVLRTA